jgi:hypothetical protein
MQPAGSCHAAWTLAATPFTNPPAAVVTSVSALSPHDVWFAGRAGYGDPQVLRWDGRSVAEPSAQIPPILLMPAEEGLSQFGYGGSFDSDTDGWVLATPAALAFTGMADIATAEHWHDGRWTMTPLAVSPSPATKGVQLAGIAALSPADAWAVGAFYQAPGPSPVSIGALIEHWDGISWTIVPNPASARPDAQLHALTAVSPTDIWAVGYQAGSSTGSIVPLVEHWDGSTWSVIPAPAGNQPSGLLAVSAAGGGVWAAGAQTQPGTTSTAIPLIEHWDGTAWNVQSLPDTGNSKLQAIYAASPNDVWAGGQFASGLTDVFLHWNGRTWTTLLVPGPQEFGLSYQYTAIGGTGPHDIWAAGTAVNGVATAVIAHLGCGAGGQGR